MATALHICSLAPAAGKTTLAAGIALHFSRRSIPASYLGIASAPASPIEGAVQIMERLLREGPDRRQRADAIFITPDREISREAALTTFAELSASSEVVIVEDGGALQERDGGSLTRFALQALPGPALLVVRHQGALQPDEVTRQVRGLPNLSGVAVTMVPANQLAEGTRLGQAVAERLQVPLLGVLPQERALFAVSVAEIAEHLQAEVLCAEENSGRMADSILIGARSFGDAGAYYSRRRDKVVVASGDRPDCMLAALETPCSCIVATGGISPQHIVMMKAEGHEVPVLLVADDTRQVMEQLDRLFSAGRFQQVGKAALLEPLLAERFNFAVLEAAVGRPSSPE